jgi:hypothetical protein
MGKSGGGGARRPSASVAERGARRVRPAGPQTAEQAHAEKVARAEGSVRKAQARVDAAAQRAHAAKSAQYETKIAKLEQQLAQTRADYAAHQRGETVTAKTATPASRANKSTTAPRASKPVPIKGADLDRYSPYGKFNPYSLLEGFGHGQLRAVLSGATPARLREAVSIVQEREPGTKPTSRSAKQSMVDYIMEHVAPGN